MKDVFSEVATVLTEKAEEAPPAEETDAQPVKRAAEEEEVGCSTQSLKFHLTHFCNL